MEAVLRPDHLSLTQSQCFWSLSHLVGAWLEPEEWDWLEEPQKPGGPEHPRELEGPEV